MIRTLTAIYLHRAGKLDARRLPVIECGMADAFRDFCRETFDVDAPLDYPPLKLVTVNSAVDLAKTLFTSDGPRGVLTDHGRAYCLFLIDDVLVDERLRWAAAFRKRVADECGRPENECFAGLEEIAGRGIDWRASGYMKDPLKIVLMLRSVKACAAFRKALLKAHIQWEKASATTILFLVTAGTAEEHFERAMVRLVLEVIATEGVGAVHGLFCRGGRVPWRGACGRPPSRQTPGTIVPTRFCRFRSRRRSRSPGSFRRSGGRMRSARS